MSLEAVERAKYEAVWTECELYRDHSPGLRHAPEALDEFRAIAPDLHTQSLTDFGCGDGRAMSVFAEHFGGGQGLDIAEHGVAITGKHSVWHIRTHCLWHPIPAEWHANFGFSCDVLEHIPPEKVDAVVANMAEAVGVAAWVQIALFPDTPRTVGDWGTLHLTVEPFEWWRDVLAERFTIAHGKEVSRRASFLLLK